MAKGGFLFVLFLRSDLKASEENRGLREKKKQVQNIYQTFYGEGTVETTSSDTKSTGQPQQPTPPITPNNTDHLTDNQQPVRCWRLSTNPPTKCSFHHPSQVALPS
jgi:hypothetical protein